MVSDYQRTDCAGFYDLLFVYIIIIYMYFNFSMTQVDAIQNKEITSQSLQQIREKISSGELTPVDVLRAYIAKVRNMYYFIYCICPKIIWEQLLAR